MLDLPAWLMTVALTVTIEVVTLFARFGLKLESSRDTSVLRHLTFGYRIHHGYIGILLLVLLFVWPGVFGRFANLFWSFGFALIFSDLIHHFVFLWWLTGSPQFDLRYPD